MELFFFGFLFLLFDYNIAVGSGTLALIPAFVGYLLLFFASRPLARTYPAFQKLSVAALPMTAFGLVCFFLPLFWPQAVQGALSLILGICATLCSLAAAWLFSEAVLAMEKALGRDLLAKKIHNAWALLSGTAILSYAGLVMQDLVLPALVLQTAGTIWFLYSLIICARHYRAYRK